MVSMSRAMPAPPEESLPATTRMQGSSATAMRRSFLSTDACVLPGPRGSVMSVTTAALSAPAAKTPTSLSIVSPPIATKGKSPIFRFHSESRSSPCGAQGIFLRMVG